MRIFKLFFWCIWRVWYYTLVITVILILSPFLLLSLSKERFYPLFFKLAKLWAKNILIGMGFTYKVQVLEKITPGNNYMFIANHTSMLDIMLMLAVIDTPFIFVGKKELSQLPIFGFFYKKAAILVDRSNVNSRSAVYKKAQERIKQGLSICIFPEGKVPDDESIVLDEFKKGAFNLAVDHQLTIVPIIFFDNKAHFSYTFFSGSPGKLRVAIGSFLNPKTFNNNKIELMNASRLFIFNQLENDVNYKQSCYKKTNIKL